MKFKTLFSLFVVVLFCLSCMTTGHKFRRFLPEESVEILRSRTDAYLSADQYKKALDVYAEAYDRCGNDVILENYLKTGNQVRNAADNAYQKKDYLKAGRIYRVLLQQGITGRESGRSLSFDEAYLKKMIRSCSKRLSEIGLVKYRLDRLDEAIWVWDQILSFDSDNQSVIKAIETANIQLKLMKSMRQD